MPAGGAAGVGGAGPVAPAVAVAVGVPGGGDPLVHAAVAVVVHTITELRGSGVDQVVVVVAVARVHHVARGQGAGGGGGGGVAVAIAIGVGVPGQRVGSVVVVSGAVTVIVHAVADLGGGGIDRGVAVVAVGVVGHGAGGGGAGLGGAGAVAVAVAVAVGVPGGDIGRVVLVGGAVTVVVHPVADLGAGGIHAGVGVVAVAVVAHGSRRGRAGRGGNAGVAVAVAVIVGVPGAGIAGVVFVHGAVTVVVHPVAQLGGPWIGAGVAVVAVGVSGTRYGHVAAGGQAGADADPRAAIAVAVVVHGPGGRPAHRGVVVVHQAVAVVVDGVADFAGGRVDRGIAVVAVGVIRGVAARGAAGLGAAAGVAVSIPIVVGVEGVEQGLVDGPVAVVVHPVADFGGHRADAGVAVVAVLQTGSGVGITDHAAGLVAGHRRAGEITVAIAVGIGVPGAGVAGVVLVDGAVAVVVHAVAGLGGVGTDRGVAVVAVLAGGPTVAVVVGIACGTVAVVVGGIGAVGLAGARIVGRVRVVAVAAVGHGAAGGGAGGGGAGVVSVAVAVAVGVPGGGAGDRVVVVVHQAVAVVVQLVADLGRVGVDVRVGVVTVRVVVHPARTGLTVQDADVGVAEAIPVGVGIPGGLEALVGHAVAVVVDVVAGFVGTRVYGAVGVVAVSVIRDPALPGVAAVGAVGWVAVAITIGVGVPDLVQILVDGPVAVVVHPIAALGSAREGLRVAVVAVGGIVCGALGGVAGQHGAVQVAVAVAIGVGVPGQRVAGVFVHQAVAVVVDPVAELFGAGVDAGVAVVAVGVGAVAVTVHVAIEDGVRVVGQAVGVWLVGVGAAAGDGQQGEDGERAHGTLRVAHRVRRSPVRSCEYTWSSSETRGISLPGSRRG